MRRLKLTIVEREPREETDKAPRTRSPRSFRLSRRLLAIGVAFVLILAVADVVLLLHTRHADDVNAARAAAMTSAGKRVPAMLSYSYKTLDADLAAAETNTTGTFRKDYGLLLSKVVAPNARDKQITTKAVVTGSSVVEAGTDRVVVLLFLTQSTVGAKGSAPLVSGSRVNVTMTRTSSGWLVSAITPV